MATLKQTLANRLNAIRSTGPRSALGKSIASTNARTHGLSRLGTIPPAEMAAAIADRKDRWRDAYHPVGEAEEWLYERLCGESVRLDFCERRILAARAEAAERAAESWDDDRAAEIAALAARIEEHPEVIQPRLLTSRHGVLWMLERWEVVASELRRVDGWTTENWFRALDLLGVPLLGRSKTGPWELDPGDATAAPGLELVRQGVEALKARLDTYLDDRDARRRDDAIAGLGDESPEVRRLERYAADARRQFSRCLSELKRLQAEAASRRPAPAPAEGPPGPRPARRPAPPTPAPAPAPPNEPASPEVAAAVAAPKPPRTAVPNVSLADGLRARLAASAPAPDRRTRRAMAAARRG